MENTMVREVFLAFVRVHILHHAVKEPVFGLEMIEELGRHGYSMSPGTLYPILHGMEKSGYLKSHDKVVGGRVRKYYRATAPGRKMLAELRAKIRELVDEVMED